MRLSQKYEAVSFFFPPKMTVTSHFLVQILMIIPSNILLPSGRAGLITATQLRAGRTYFQLYP